MATDVSIFLPNLHGGGAERVMVTLANAFAAQGMQTDMVLARAEGELLADVNSRVEVVDLGAKRVFASVRPLAAYLKAAQPAAFLSALSHANVAAIMARKIAGAKTRLVVSERNVLTNAGASTVDRLMPLAIRALYPAADRIIAVSTGVADDLQRIAGIRRQSIEVIYNPVVTSELIAGAAEPLMHAWAQTGEAPIILAAGRLSAQKDFRTLLQAFALVRRLRPVRLVVLGEGEERGELARLARELGVEADCLFPGFVANPFSWMSAAKVFVLSSRWEGLPGVLIQAMACGASVVATDCHSGPDEILEGGRWGALTPVGDITAMAEAITLQLDRATDPAVKQRAYVFSLDRAVAAYATALRLETVHARTH